MRRNETAIIITSSRKLPSLFSGILSSFPAFVIQSVLIPRVRVRPRTFERLDEFATPGQLALAGDLECHLPSRSLRDCVQ
jgi:hypothetical protein